MAQSPDSVQPIFDPSEVDELISSTKSELDGLNDQAGKSAKVYLVGAGPGDPRLLTLRGYQCLQRADYVLYDGLANLALLQFATKAEIICVGKHGKARIWSQAEINQQMIVLAQRGKTVVRLKGGDPAVFARTAEELEALHCHGIAYEVVPGITAALAVSGYTGLPLTHRDHSSAVALVTGMQQDGSPVGMDWQSLARFPGTLSIYMGVTSSRYWTDRLIEAGKSPETPATIVRRCTWSDQKIVYCRLDEVAGHLTPASKMRPPVLVIVGEVAHLGRQWNWFSRLPLGGVGVWLPRPAQQNDELAAELEELGASVVAQPAVEIRRPSDVSDLERAVISLRGSAFQGVVFSSVNGVDGMMEYIFSQGLDARLLAAVRLAAVGPATANQLKKYGLVVDEIPERDFSAAGLVEHLGDSVHGQHWLVTRTTSSRDVLAEGIQRSGGTVSRCLTYETAPVEHPGDYWAEFLQSGRMDYVLITSSLVAECAHRLLGADIATVKPIALSASVADKLQRLGWPCVAIASSNTAGSLLEALLKTVKSFG
jgi:uroporphyrinogen III methyltransferase/synthase